MDGSANIGKKRGREKTTDTKAESKNSSVATTTTSGTSNPLAGVKSGGKNKKKVPQAFDTPYSGSKGVRIVPGSAESQSNALAALSRLSNVIDGRKSLGKVFIFGVNAVCRSVEAADAPKRVGACCISASTPSTPGSRIAFGVGSPTEVLTRHIALCCAQHKIPVVILSETDSAELGRVVCMPSALAFALRPLDTINSIEGIPKDVPTIAASVMEKLRAAQATVEAPWLCEEFVGDFLKTRIAPCLENPAREPQRQARAAELKQKQKDKQTKQQKQQPQPPPTKKKR